MLYIRVNLHGNKTKHDQINVRPAKEGVSAKTKKKKKLRKKFLNSYQRLQFECFKVEKQLRNWKKYKSQTKSTHKLRRVRVSVQRKIALQLTD
jgi:hypothetical protein